MTITIDGICLEISKKHIKNIHIHVKPPDGHVVVSAPNSISYQEIERFVVSKLGWIKKHVARFCEQPRQAELSFVSGETLCVWGVGYTLDVRQGGNKNLLVLSGNEAIFIVKKDSTILQRSHYIKEWYRKLLKDEIERLLPKWEKITGLKASSWQTKSMTTRWGTCNYRTKKLWFALQLTQKPQSCLEYIILHELIHIIEKNHNARFYSLLDKHMPNWREIRANLNSSKPIY